MSDGNALIVTYIEVAPAAAKTAAAIVKTWRERSRNSDGSVRVEALQRLAPSNQFVIVSIWRDDAAFTADREAVHTTDALDKLAPLLISGVDTRIHNAMIGGADTAPGRGAVFVVTHIDVPPPNKDACIALIEAQVAASRADPGRARFEVFQQADRPNHFSAVEAWTDRTAFDAHIVTGHTTQFRMKLTPLSGSLYDERIYQAAT
jgi:quinol monooxygenase YgiN